MEGGGRRVAAVVITIYQVVTRLEPTFFISIFCVVFVETETVQSCKQIFSHWSEIVHSVEENTR